MAPGRGILALRECRMPKLIDMTGQRFGMLLVAGRSEKKASTGRFLWECLCDCGNTAHCSTANIRSGASTSCGCVRTKHKGKGTRLYRIWAGMKDRCLNPKSQYRKRYGGKGVRICKEWATDFAIFRDWALSSGYKEDLTIDRIENDGNYEPGNCQWLTRVANSVKGDR